MTSSYSRRSSAPQTGKPADADPTHRHAVRLSAVTMSSDKLGGQFATPPNTNPVAVTEIEWVAEDALPFPLCISSEVRQGNTETPVEGISVARGNIVLADNGRTIADEELKAVPQPTLLRIPTRGRRPLHAAGSRAGAAALSSAPEENYR